MKEGEELCDNYGPSWGGGGEQGLRERRKALASEFGFTCCCIACAAEEKDEVQRFQEAEKRNLKQDKKEEDGEAGDGERHSINSLNELWTVYKKNQELSWREGNLRLENIRK